MDSAGIWKGVLIAALGTVAGGLALAALSWAFGFHHQAWLAIVAAAGWLWGALVYFVPVPVVALVIFTGFVLYVWRGVVLRKRALRTTVTTAEPPPLTGNEIAVVRVLAGADGRSMSGGALAHGTGLSNLVVGQAIDRLLDRDFLDESPTFDRGPKYRLSAAGRDYAIAEGYVARTDSARPFPIF